MNKYEGIFIVRPNMNEEESKAILDLIEDEIKKNEGTIEAVNNWGKKALAYPISKFDEGLYHYLDFSIVPSAIKDMQNKFRLNEDILRFLIIKKEQ